MGIIGSGSDASAGREADGNDFIAVTLTRELSGDGKLSMFLKLEEIWGQLPNHKPVACRIE